MKNENVLLSIIAVLFCSFIFTFYKYRQKRRLLQKDRIRDLSWFGVKKARKQ
ncbi:MAG: hypothetical protein II567_11975 [Candidatus Riflebacteria bacterium]|nr:hypothetical protein [Candidatus Riflebacteria bacterium]